MTSELNQNQTTTPSETQQAEEILVHPNISLDRVLPSTDNEIILPPSTDSPRKDDFKELERVLVSYPNVDLSRDSERIEQRQVLCHPNIKKIEKLKKQLKILSKQFKELENRVTLERQLKKQNFTKDAIDCCSDDDTDDNLNQKQSLGSRSVKGFSSSSLRKTQSTQFKSKTITPCNSVDVCDTCMKSAMKSSLQDKSSYNSFDVSKCKSLDVCRDCAMSESYSSVDDQVCRSAEICNRCRNSSSILFQLNERDELEKTPKQSCVSFDICKDCSKSLGSKTTCSSTNICDFCNHETITIVNTIKCLNTCDSSDVCADFEVSKAALNTETLTSCQSSNICELCRNILTKCKQTRSALAIGRSFESFEEEIATQDEENDEISFNSDCETLNECNKCSGPEELQVSSRIGKEFQVESNCLSVSFSTNLVPFNANLTPTLKINECTDDRDEKENYSKRYLKMKYEIELKNFLIDKLNRELQMKKRKCRPQQELRKLKNEILKEIKMLRQMIRFAIKTQREHRTEKWGPITISTVEERRVMKNLWNCSVCSKKKLKPPKTPSGISNIIGFEELNDSMLEEEKSHFVNSLKLQKKEKKIKAFRKRINEMKSQLKRVRDEFEEMKGKLS